jgi:predicted DNA-binding transcriptional regulator AlpA
VKPERIARMPDWPARMDEGMAADYLGVSRTTLRDKVKAHSYPQPVREGGRLLWARRQLDIFIESQFGINEGGDATWDDYR